MDSKDYIERYKDFTYGEVDELLDFVRQQIEISKVVKIHIRKWNV